MIITGILEVSVIPEPRTVLLLARGLWAVSVLLRGESAADWTRAPTHCVGLGAVSLHALFVNCTLLPREVRPSWFMRIGVVFCSAFFFGISGIVFVSLL